MPKIFQDHILYIWVFLGSIDLLNFEKIKTIKTTESFFFSFLLRTCLDPRGPQKARPIFFSRR